MATNPVAGAPVVQQMVRITADTPNRTDGFGVWSDDGQFQTQALNSTSNAEVDTDTGNKLVTLDKFTGTVPQEWGKEARIGRLAATDAAVNALHRSMDANPNAVVSVSDGCLLPGERVVAELHCAGNAKSQLQAKED